MTRNRLPLECSHCRRAKLIDVAISDDGAVGAIVCDECKTNDLSLAAASRRRLRHRSSLSPR
jgi:hypothetical protein